MTSPGGRIEIRVDPDLRGFGTRLSSGLTDSARSGVAAFASAAKVALLGAAVGIGAAGIVAAKSTLNIGIEYQNQLNTLQAVSGATEAQMKSVGVTAKALGQDMSLPATSAADAAAVMTELAKASFSVADAQTAAKGSLQLAAAAQIDGAQAAQIQANAINAFSLKASDASRVADVLANAANASSAEITDVADALAQAGAVASSAHVSLEDTATVIGILANNGIKGSDAGTLLKSALLALQSPSKQAQQAMSDLNLTAYDQHGNFVGLKSIFEQLQVAQGRMTQQQYDMATSTLFGSDAARLAGIAAKEGGKGFDEMAAAIGRQGSAAEVAAAKSKGLGGAIQAFKSQVETVQIDVFERAAPSLERLVRMAAERLPDVAASALDTADHVVAAFQDLAPRIGQALAARRDTVVAAWHQLGEPLLAGAKDVADKGIDVIVHGAQNLEQVAGQAIDKVEPLAKSVGNFASSLAKAGGPLDAVDKGIDLLASGANLAMDVLGPFVRLAGNAVNIVAGLPGPLESAVVGLVALKAASNIDFFSSKGTAAVSGVGSAVKTTTAAFTSLSGEMAVQQALFAAEARDAELAAAGLGSLNRALGATAVAGVAADASLSNVQRMMFGYDAALAQTTVEQQRLGLWGDTAGASLGRLGAAGATVAARGLSAAKTAGAGLVSLLGGPWGVAITGAVLGIGALNSVIQHHDEQVKKATADVATWYKTLSLGGSPSDVSKAQKNVDDLTAKIADLQKRIDAYNAAAAGGNGRGGIGTLISQQKDLRDELAKGQGDWLKQSAGMSLVELATARLQGAQSALNEALKKGDPTAIAAAQGNYAIAQANLATQTDRAAQAQKSQTQVQQEAAQAALAATNADVAASMAQTSLSQQISSSAAAIAQYGANSLEGRAATDQLTQSALQAANAAGAQAAAHAEGATAEQKQAVSDAALLASLQATAQQLGSDTPAAITQLIASLVASASSGAETAGRMRDLGLAVTEIPGQKAVIIDAPTADQEARLSALGYHVTHLPNGQVLISASTDDANNAINQVARDRTATIFVREVVTSAGVHVSGGEGTVGGTQTRARGGYIAGRGTWTSDSIPLWASNGEYMIRAAMTARSRPGLDAVNRGDWSAAAKIFSTLAEGQSRASMAAMAGSRAAQQAGRFAAGGYVSAKDRSAAATVVSVPQRVQNIQNVLNAAPSLPTLDQLQRMLREAEVLAGA